MYPVNFQPSGFTDQGSIGSDNLIAGDFPIKTQSIVIVDGAGVLPRGTVLQVSATAGKYEEVTDDAEAVFILAEDVDATDADVTTTAYITGQFNKRALSIGTGATLAGVTATLRPLSIFIQDSVPA